MDRAEEAVVHISSHSRGRGFFRGPIVSLDDIREIESVPLEERMGERSAYDFIAQAAENDPDKPALISLRDGALDEAASEMRYRDLLDRLHRLANLLASLALSRDDAVAIVLPNVEEAFWVPLAVGLAATAFPVNWMLEPDALVRQLEAVRPKLIIALGPAEGFDIWQNVCAAQAELPHAPPIIPVAFCPSYGTAVETLEVLCAAQSATRPLWLDEEEAFSGDALLLSTGGTTGNPKIVPITHRAVAYKIWACASLMDMRPEHRVFGALPQFHVGGIVHCTLSSLCAGSTIVIPGVNGFRAKHVMRNYWKFVERFGITDLCGVPTIFSALSQIPVDADISCLREIALTGSAALPVSLGEYFERVAGVRILGGYGMTENSGTACMPPRNGDPGYGSCGIRYPYTKVKVARISDDETSFIECDAGEPGEIIVDGPGVVRGLLDASHDAKLFVDGWLRTGDIGRMDDRGYLRITGRSKDLIIRSGHNIDPRAIEDALLSHPSVSAAAAVAMPDAYAGELPVAFVELEPNADVEVGALLEFARTGIPERAAVPVNITILSSLPRTAIGKVFRPELRRQAIQRVFSTIIAEAGGQSNIVSIEVEAKPEGTEVRVNLASRGASDAGLEHRLLSVFSRFTFPIHLTWAPATPNAD